MYKIKSQGFYGKLACQDYPTMQILHVKILIKHFGSMYRSLCFVPNLIQIIIDIVMLGCRPNIDMELCKTFL
jgi:hypothetical protein